MATYGRQTTTLRPGQVNEEFAYWRARELDGHSRRLPRWSVRREGAEPNGKPTGCPGHYNRGQFRPEGQRVALVDLAEVVPVFGSGPAEVLQEGREGTEA